MKTLFQIVITKLFLMSFLFITSLMLANTLTRHEFFFREKTEVQKESIPGQSEKMQTKKDPVMAKISLPENFSLETTLTSDQPDYSPGSTATLTGTGFGPFETIHMQVVHADGTTNTGADHEPWDIVADTNGSFITSWHVCEDDCVGATLKATADGQTSGLHAEVLFTDALTNPVAQSLPYSQNFSSLPYTGFGSDIYPSGWQGWKIGGSSSASFRTSDPNIAGNADGALVAGSSASTTTGGVLNYDQKIGMLASGSFDPAIVLAINTTGSSNILIQFDIMTIRNPYNASTNTRINQVDLQYRVGTSGSFASVSGLANGIYENNTTTQTGSGVTTPQNSQAKLFLLPATCNNQSVVQLRWVQRDFSGGGSRAGFAIDNISLAACTAPVITATGSSLSLGCNPSTAAINAALGTATASEGCGTPTITFTDGEVISSGCSRSQKRTFTATDGAGNSSTTSRTVTWKEDTDAPEFTGDYSTVTLGCNPSSSEIDAALGTAAATDNCSTVTITQSDGSVSGACSKLQTRTFTATDGCGNSSTTSRTVKWTYDLTAPVITCPTVPPGSIKRSTNSGKCYYTINGTEFDATATDDCSTVFLLWSITGATTASGNTTLAGVDLNFGANTITWTASDACGNISTCSIAVDVNKVTTKTTVTVDPASQQYSDKVKFSATITSCAGAGTISGTVKFKIGSLEMGTASVASDGTATLEVALSEPSLDPANPTNGPMKPGIKTVTACYSGDGNYLASTSTETDNLLITKEDARIYYTGACYASTSSPTSSSATVTLSATVKDITAETSDSAYDPLAGDIRNAGVYFYIVETSETFGPFKPGLVNPGDTKTGTVTYNWNVNIGTANSKTYTIRLIVNNYYTRDNSFDDGVVTVAKPLPDLFISGGGYLVLTNSAGIKAGTAGTKNNFGYNVQYNKNKTNLQGYINTIIRKQETDGLHIYQVKGNAMSSLVVNAATCPKTAIFNGKASIQDITNPLNPQSVDGNAVLQVKMTDSGEPGNTDKIAITVWNKDGGLWFASNWNGTSTIEQVLGGGNLKVHGGAVCTASTQTNLAKAYADMEVKSGLTPFNVKAYPNPAEHQVTLIIENGSNEKINVIVYDVVGRQVKKFERMDSRHPIQFGSELKTGTYIVEVHQGVNRKTVKLIKQ